MLEEWKIDMVGVLALYDYPPVLIVPSDLEVRLGSGAGKERICLAIEAAVYLIILQMRSHPGLRPHTVQNLVVSQVDLTDVHSVVQRRSEQGESNQTAETSRPPPGKAGSGYHWDWAPSTIFTTKSSRAFSRPSDSRPAS